MNNCPCCSNTLLRHWEQKKTYWYCRNCRQEMPNLELADLVNNYQQKKLKILSQLSPKSQVAYSLNEV